MADGPWTQYQSAPSDGPWSQYQKTAPKADGYNAAEDTPDYEKTMVNIGAGLQNLIDGVSQLFGKGPSDDETKYRRKIDQQAAESQPYLGKVLQVGAEVLPTLAVPAGGLVRGAGAVSNLGKLAAAVGDSAGMGAISGALTPTTSDESKLANAAIGGTVGAVVPGAVGGTAALTGWLKNALTKGGAEAKAAQRMIDAIRSGGMTPEDAIAAVKGAQGGIPLTAAEATQSLPLGQLQRQSARDNPADFADFRSQQAQARFQALQDATKGADNLEASKSARDASTGPLRDEALGTAQLASDQAGPDWLKEPVANQVGDILGKYPPSSPAYKVAKIVGGDLENATPASLYETRKVLTAKLNGPAQLGDEMSAATKGARRETMQIVDSIDTALDTATGGKWGEYLSQYGSKSKEVNSAQALKLIRSSYEKNATPMLGDVPNVTGTNLGRAMDKYGSNSYGATLDDSSMQALQDLRANLGKTEGLQKQLALAGTSGGGSNTAMDIAQSLTENKLVGAVPILKDLLKRSDSMTNAAVSDALRNPEVFIAGVSKRLKANQPLSPSQDAILRMIRGATAALPASVGAQ